ncbi:hypothetical protein SAMN05216249_10940 [Acetitomaculum ruminis DSM 5522]|uniref:Uncharacterized protein n=1 Tax=Acetitomaculum ruminis DSM 5522 TaxID=1120918 RepID=A0A1I0YCC1_9FIRM|nr:DUF5702 domain-containing protein [Acetitomaculum ruminis]SFB09833.1 hypothetical protein SAMN05216249_10940 [Acetitomaculum ruminis DSM 5522]
MRKKGSITVFLSLLLAAVLGASASICELIRIKCIETRYEEVIQNAGNSLLACFCPLLLKDYDLFFLDGGFGKNTVDLNLMKKEYKAYIDENIFPFEGMGLSKGGNLLQFKVKNIEIKGCEMAVDNKGEIFRKEAVEYMKESKKINLIKDILNLSDKKEKYGNFDASKENADKTLSLISDNELLSKVMDIIGDFKLIDTVDMVLKSKRISEKSIDNTKLPSLDKALNNEEDINNGDKSLISTVLFDEYILEHFGNYTNKKEKNLDYEVEYILAGNMEDKENLREVINRLLVLRQPFNYAYLNGDVKKREEAAKKAALIATLTMLPEYEEAFKQVILFYWSMKESVDDVKKLLDGKEVPLIKKSENKNAKEDINGKINLEKDKEKKEKDNGLKMDYKAYLHLLLLLTDEETKTLRTMDLIEKNISSNDEYKNFKIKNCIYSFEISQDIVTKGRFMPLSMLDNAYFGRINSSLGRAFSYKSQGGY